MNNITAPRGGLAIVAAAAALLAACASVEAPVAWNILPPGSSWQVEQRNTGSYGRDATMQFTRGEGSWQGSPAVTFFNATTGSKVMSRPDGRWFAIVGREGKVIQAYDPPLGYVYPLSVGQSWSTKHKVTTASGAVTDFTYSCKVEAREKVTVPAGTFDTMRIACETPVSRDVSWTIVDMGMHAKQEFERFAGHPQGAGTQKVQLVAVKRGG
jgi:hypothetical protein